MAANFILKQHLQMSPNAQIKNFVPETLEEPPPSDKLKKGRMWFNSSLGKYQGVFPVLDEKTGLPKEPEELEVRIIGIDELGPTSDGEYWPDGLFNFQTTTKVSDAMDEVNEALKDLAPPEATALMGGLDVNIQDGFNSGRLSEIDNNAPFDFRLDGVSAGQFLDYIVKSDKFTADLPTQGYEVKNQVQKQFGKADQGKLRFVLDSEETDGFIDLQENYYETARDFNDTFQGFNPDIDQTVKYVDGTTETVTVNPNKEKYTTNTSVLTVDKVERYNSFKKWQRGIGHIEFGQTPEQPLLTPGNHSFFVEHYDVLGGPYKTDHSHMFYDPSEDDPETTITNFELVGGSKKFVSGVSFYHQDISFKISTSSKNVFSYTYWDLPLKLTMSGTDAGDIEWNHPDSNLKDKTVPKWNDELIITDHEINYIYPNSEKTNLTVFAKSGKVKTGWGNTDYKSIDVLIDTNSIATNSTFLKETFLDEDFRLSDEINFDDSLAVLDYVGVWDSTKKLNDGQAQQFLGELMMPSSDYTEYGQNTGYSEFVSSEHTYYRPIHASNRPNSNGTLSIKTQHTIGVDFEVYIKIPGQTGWLDINSLYDSQEFSNNKENDGVGCLVEKRIKYDGCDLDWTIGTLSTVDSNYTYIVKVILKNNSVKIQQIEEISENWS